MSELETFKSAKGTPPRLAIVNNADGTRAGCAVLLEHHVINASSQLTEALRDILFVYYVFDLTYPKHYQLLGFIQQFVLEDNENKFFTSSAYIKLLKEIENV